MLEWTPPADTGGRGDLSYSVGCVRCLGQGPVTRLAEPAAGVGPGQEAGSSGECEPCGANVGFLPQQSGLTEHSVTVLHLLPASNYTFTVEALNGVSDMLRSLRSYAQVHVSTSLSGRPEGGDVRGGWGFLLFHGRTAQYRESQRAQASAFGVTERMASQTAPLCHAGTVAG